MQSLTGRVPEFRQQRRERGMASSISVQKRASERLLTPRVPTSGQNDVPTCFAEELTPFAHPDDDSLAVRWSTGSVQVGIAACVTCTHSSAVEQDEDRI